MPEKVYDKVSTNSDMSLGTVANPDDQTSGKHEIRVAIAGLGNCAAALVMGIEFYKNISPEDSYINGLMNPSVGGYLYKDIKIVAAFDINSLKIGKDIRDAIYEAPNVVQPIVSHEDMPITGVKVSAGPILDGCAPHMIDSFHCYKPEEIPTCDVAKVLKESNAEILVNFLPVGSFEASRAYAQAALDASCGFINAIPEFIVSEHIDGDKDWVAEFEKKGLPCAGDDIKSQVGATISHRVLAKLFLDRGVVVKDTYQLNIGGNTDFENMKMENRLTTKRKSKTSAVTSCLPYDIDCRIGPSDYVPFLEDKKICYIRINGITFGGLPLVADLKLRVEDSPNSAGVVCDIIRVMKLALNRKIAGRLESISSFSFKHPHIQPPSDVLAKEWVKEFIEGKRKN
ncbi:inositol-3-phosphate synthase [Candidatus Lokiarchaeum ossiferum]|uniref:inositol-3-phosphate synthase n=1 Tax=Candidatus Lokiarchaeum ossiferum TaxID=2951803 RepID=UPI00352E5675